MMVFSLSAQIVEKTFFFDKPNFEEYQGYEQISFGTMSLSDVGTRQATSVQGAEEGNPVMPWHSVSLLLPQNTEAQDIEFEFSDFVEVEGSHLLYPYQRPRPLSLEEELPFVKNESVYASKEVYPSRYSAEVETQYLNGYSFAFSGFTPVRYVPATGKVSYAKTVTVRVKYAASKSDKSKMLKTSPEIVSRVERLAQNPEDVRFYSANGGQKSIGGYELMVITPEEWVSSFDEYKAFYSSQGLRTKVFSLESIYASSEGRDDQEKIRTFIANEYENEGIMMVLLGGDSKLVPYRGLYCYVMEDYEDELPADMYYVCLDGTWNDDNDESWGEPGEDDLLPELAIGRMPFNNETQFNNMMHKTLEYQRNPVLGEFNDIVFGAEHLGDGYYGSTDLELLIGEQDEDYYTTVGIPTDYNFHRVYANGETGWSGTIFRNKINEVGGGYVHHVGHANTDYVAGWYVSSTDHKSFSQLDGVNHNYNFFHSHGCICGDFTSTCILERLVNISTGFVAATGNSRYGWYIPWGDGPARHLHREFVDAYYHDRLPYIGTAFVEMKIATAPYVADMWGENGALRWNMYCINILGDVAVKPWLDEPFIPEVSYDLALNGGTSSTEVVVKKDNEPQSNFRCSLYYGDELLAFGMTDENGKAEIVFSQALNIADTMQLIVTGPNAWCQTYDVLGLNNQSSFVYAKTVTMEDNNNNSLLDYSENISLNIDFYNAGLGVNNIISTLTTTSQDFIELLNDEVNVGNIGSNSTKSVADAFSFKVKDGVPDQQYVFLTITSTDGSNVWSQDLVYRLQAPVFEMYDITYDDVMGNDNGFVEAGESLRVYFRLKNIGNSKSDDVLVTASSSNQYVSFDEGVSAGELNVDQVVSKYLVIEIDENTPEGEQFTIDLKLTSGEYEIHDELRFTVGTIKEDFETGDFSHLNWKFDNDLPWVITDELSHSGNYCVESGHIDDDEISSLLIEVENTSDGIVSFYYKVSTSKTDYFVFYIDGVMQERWSGEVDWQYVSYDVPAGVHVFEWRYDKSPNIQEGQDRCWVDDILFPSNSLVLDVNTITESKTFDIYPNPAKNYIVVKGDDIVVVEIFDMMGRKILTQNVKDSSVVNVNDFPQGLYLIRSLDVNNNITVKKFVKE